MTRRRLTSCCLALLAFVLVIAPQGARPQDPLKNPAKDAQLLQQLEDAKAAQLAQQGNDQPQQPDPPPPKQPKLPPPGERPQPGCITLLGKTSDGC